MNTFFSAPHIHLPSVDSTNNYASNLLKLPDTKDKSVITTDFQTSGKGQRGNTWTTLPGNAFLGSFIVPCKLNQEKLFNLSKWIALCLAEIFSEMGVSSVSIKWPNDIWVNNQKIAGILIENQWQGNQIKHSIVGIGINLLPTPPALLKHSTSLQQQLNKTYSLSEILKLIQLKFDQNWKFLDPKEEATLAKKYFHFLLGANTKLCWTSERFNGKLVSTIKKVDADGALHLSHEKTEKMKFYHGELKFV